MKNISVFKLVGISSAVCQPLHPPDMFSFVCFFGGFFFLYFVFPVEMLINLIVVPEDEIALLEYSPVDSTLSLPPSSQGGGALSLPPLVNEGIF